MVVAWLRQPPALLPGAGVSKRPERMGLEVSVLPDRPVLTPAAVPAWSLPEYELRAQSLVAGEALAQL